MKIKSKLYVQYYKLVETILTGAYLCTCLPALQGFCGTTGSVSIRAEFPFQVIVSRHCMSAAIRLIRRHLTELMQAEFSRSASPRQSEIIIPLVILSAELL